MFTDVQFTCPTLAFASVVDDAYVDHHSYVSDDNPLGLGAPHGAELAGLFGHVEGIAVGVIPSDRGDQLSAASLQAAWSAFATVGDPGELFDPYSEGATVTLLDVPLEQVDTIRDDRCATAYELSTLSGRRPHADRTSTSTDPRESEREPTRCRHSIAPEAGPTSPVSSRYFAPTAPWPTGRISEGEG